VKALIGLGNPGNRYMDTRHNIGYLIVDLFSSVKKIPFQPGKGDYYYKDLEIDDREVLVFKPTTYMNKSGRAVSRIIEDFSLNIEDLLVICDDFNLPFGAFRFRQKGSDGGHNGLKSIIYNLQSENFERFRFGIGNAFSDASQYVLESFSRRESEKLNELLPISTEAIHHWLKEGIQTTMNRYNRQFISENS
jgi:PTH1 family peptidyl-tRNA hydrolase